MNLTPTQRRLIDKLYHDVCDNSHVDWDINSQDYFLDLLYILKLKED